MRLLLRVLLLGAVIALPVTDALAWGHAGHAAVGALADANLTPVARAEVQELLASDLDRRGKPSGRKTLAGVASWADQVRADAWKTDPAAMKGWHTRGNQVCGSQLKDCPDGACVDQMIIHFAAILGDRSQPLRARNEALKFVVHLVGDLHQPMHSGVNINSGPARAVLAGLDPRPDATLHMLWDTDLAEAALRDWKPTAKLGETRPLPPDAPTQWMIEAREVSLQSVYKPLAEFTCAAKLQEPIVLDQAYQQQSVPVVRRQIERAGLRLAQLINETLLP